MARSSGSTDASRTWTPRPSDGLRANGTATRTAPPGRGIGRASGRQYWNAQGRRFSRSFFGAPTTMLYLEEEQQLFRRHLGSLAGKRLLKLDLWNEAQNTELLFWTARQGATCYGIDIAETTALKGRDRSRAVGVPIRVIIGDILELPFPDDSFDCLYTMGTLEHVPRADRVMAEVARVVKPGGVAIVGVPNKLDPFLFAVASRVLQAFRCYPYGYERWFTNGELSRELQIHGLRVIRRDGILLFPWFLRFLDLYLWLHTPWACRLTGLLLEPFRALARFRGLVRRFGYLTVCIAQK